MRNQRCIVTGLIAAFVAFGCDRRADTEPAKTPKNDSASTAALKVKMETTQGDIVVGLDLEKSPATVLNFLDYVAEGFYDGTVFHRVVSNKVVQGGGYTPDMVEKTGSRPPVVDESYNGLKNERWTIAMFRVPNNFTSARTQFFINVVENPSFDILRDGGGYTVFGRVIDGIDVVGKIRDARVGPHPNYAAGKNPVVPVEPIVIRSMRLLTPFDREAAVVLAQAARDVRSNRINLVVKRLEIEAKTKGVATESGLRYVDFHVGNGSFPSIDEAVNIRYRGTLVDGKEFDSSALQPDGSVTVNVKSAVEGLREGLLSMHEGGKRTLVIPPQLAYGADGIPGKVPPNATLILEIELLAAKPAIPQREIEPTSDEP